MVVWCGGLGIICLVWPRTGWVVAVGASVSAGRGWSVAVIGFMFGAFLVVVAAFMWHLSRSDMRPSVASAGLERAVVLVLWVAALFRIQRGTGSGGGADARVVLAADTWFVVAGIMSFGLWVTLFLQGRRFHRSSRLGR